ncbi:elongation of very long chain fatty acids protein AAEL008004-like isoform X2 [Varroa jacobsoni]|uniref:Elongation of very long chain fatty acids protein n=1 Tax=Varroa destructor TaxID=109461 RepID=A0A7M7KZJ5_VARDE|nr:elongation of very long chain fatty acids protein AAEL008004-like isoform X2 [Varroa destructor]XP_022710496.1 elongation of very long chain fatty acids protein AAEL008004-like isoform X2 [Varroa jacobsoni]
MIVPDAPANVVMGTYATSRSPDQGVRIAYDKEILRNGWLLVDTWVPALILCSAYVSTVKVFLPRYMKDRPPLDIMSFIRAFNLFQVLANFWFAIQVGRRTYFGGSFSWLCQGVMGRDDPVTLDLLRLLYVYIWVRVVDLLDTVFFGLRHKWTHVSTLNVSHHCIVLLFGVYGVRHGADSHMTLVVLVNQCVHVIMFTYYFFASFGDRFRKYLTWKRYLTGIQLAQFFVLGVHSVLPLVFPCPGLPAMHSIVAISSMTFFFIMFARFYVQTYGGVKQELSKIPVSFGCKLLVENKSL